MMETGCISSPTSVHDGDSSRSSSTPCPVYAQVLSNCWNASSSPKPGEKNSNCLLCFQEQVSLAEAEPSSSSSSGRSKLLKHFCELLQLNSAEIPEQCSKMMFPLCEICESELDLMFEHKQIILRSLSMISLMAKRMEKKVVREAEDWRTNPVHQAGDKFTRLWDMIMEGYHKREEGDATVDEDVDATSPADSQSGLNDSQQDRDNRGTNNDETTPSNPEGEPVTVNANPDACPMSVTVKKEGMLGQQFSTTDDGEIMESDDEIQRVTPQKRRTLCEGVEYFQRIRRPGDEKYLQCSLCKHTVQKPNKLKRGELTAYKKLALHMQTEHERACKKKVNSPGTTTPEVDATRRQSSEPPLQPSTSRDSLNANIIKTENGFVNPVSPSDDEPKEDDPGLFTVEPRKRKYTFESVEILKCAGSRNPQNIYLQCGRCSETVPIIPNNKKGEGAAYGKIKTHIQTSHRNRKKSSSRKAQAGGESNSRFQSDQSQVKLESPRPGPSFMNYCAPPLTSGSSLNSDGSQIDMPPVPTDPFSQPSVADEMPDAVSDDGRDEAMNLSMMMNTPSPAPHSPFYNYVYGNFGNIGGV